MVSTAAKVGAISIEAESKRLIIDAVFNNRFFENALTINALSVFPSNSIIRFMKNDISFIYIPCVLSCFQFFSPFPSHQKKPDTNLCRLLIKRTFAIHFAVTHKFFIFYSLKCFAFSTSISVCDITSFTISEEFFTAPSNSIAIAEVSSVDAALSVAN